MEPRSCSSTMLFIFGFYPIFIQKYEFKFNVRIFLIMASSQKMVLAPGVTIRDNTAYDMLMKKINW